MNTLLLIFLAPFLTSTAVGQVQDVQQDSFFDTAALKVYCRLGFTFNQDTTHCSPTIEEQPQTVQEKVVEVVRNVFVPVASAQEPSDSYLEAMIRRIVLELLPQPQLVQGPKGDKGDKGDPGTQTFGSDLLNTPVTFWTGGGGSSSSGGTTVVNNYYTASSGTSTVSSNTLTFSTTTGILTSDVGGVVATTTIGVASTTTITADNGLTINPANNVQLGGILTQDTSIDLDTRVLDFDQTSTSSRFRIRGASGYAAGFSTQDIFQLEHYVGEGFAISSYEQGPLVTDPHGTFLNFTDNLASPVMSPNGAYLYSDQTSGEIGMGRWAGGQISITPTSVTTLSPGSITVSAQGNIVTTSDNEQSFLANNANALGPVSSGFNFNVFNGTGNDIAIANFNGGAGQGVDMFVGQFDPNGQYTADPGSFYYNMSPANDDEILWLKGTGGGGAGTNTGWVPVLTGTSTGSAWLLAGNSGTNSANDFVGTTDAQDLVFRTNNAEVVRFTQTGRFDFTNPLANVLLDGGNETMTGAFNIAIGESALSQNNTGSGNVVMGNNAALLNTTGSSNVAIGQAALLLNNGDTNTAVGQGAGIVSNGTSNTFIGYGAGNAQTAGDNNILIGQLANVANTTGSNQLSIGNWIYGDNGSIGVGTPTPDDDFEVVNAAGAGVSVDTESGSGAEARLTVQTGDGSGTWGESVLYLNTGGDSLGQQWWMFMDDSTLNELGDANRLGFYDGTDIVMSLDGDSNRLGIGTTTPATALHVEHSLNSAGGIRVSNYSTGTAAISQLLFQNASSTGGIGLLGPNFALPNLANRLGVVADPGLSGLYLGTHATGQDIVFNTGGFVSANERMRISATGEIGIGTPTPTERLDVSGNVRFSGALMPNNLAGATGTILLSQGSGLAPVWIATSSLGISASISSSTIASNFGFIQNGNSFGTTGVLGTNDAFGLTFETVNTPRVTIGTTGAIVVAGETLGGGTYTMNVGASAGSHALRVTGVSDTIYAQQGGGSDVFTIRTAGTNTFLNATAGNTLALGVGGTTDNSMSIASNGDTTVRHRFFVSDAFTGSGVARVGQTIQSATNSGNQTGATTQLLIQPNDGGLDSTGTNIGLDVNMDNLSGGTNLAARFNTGATNTLPILTIANTAGDFQIFRTDVAPENFVTGSIGDIAVDGTNGKLYIKSTGIVTSTGWLDLVGNNCSPSGSGANNECQGTGALQLLTTGYNNVAFGDSSLANTTIGYANVAVGFETLLNNVDGFSNVSIGTQSLRANTSGFQNTAIGVNAMITNTTGSNNTAVGMNALYSNTTGIQNTAMGLSALYSNSSGVNNTANGMFALQFTTTGGANTAMGASALRFNITGNSNVGIGVQAALSNTTGSNNVVIGRDVLTANTTGSNNVVIGMNSLNSFNVLDSSGNNTVVGYSTGGGITTGINNTIIGANVIGLPTTLSNNIILADGSGNRRINVDSTGNVGIGTTTPLTQLHVVSGNTNGLTLQTTGNAALLDFRTTGVTPANRNWRLVNNFSTGGTLEFHRSSNAVSDPSIVTARFTSSGNFGLNVNPGSLLSVNGNAAIGGTGYSDVAAPTNGLIVQGNTGIGTNAPLFLLHTGSSSITSGTTVARFENAGGTCDVTPNVAGGITCTSDQNLKKDIEAIDPIDSLQKLLAVEVKSYRMNADEATSTKQVGFLAQQLETQFPGLVLTSVEGRKSVSYAGMTPILTQAIQTLYKFMEDIGVVVENGVAKVGDFVATKVKTDELCVGSVCVTESQFLQMVQNAQITTNTETIQSGNETVSGNGDENASTTTPIVSGVPVIESQADENNTSVSSGTFVDIETGLSDIEATSDTMSDMVQNTDPIVQEIY